MNPFGKKKIIALLKDLLHCNQSLKQEEKDILPEVWMESLCFFQDVIVKLDQYFDELETKEEALSSLSQAYYDAVGETATVSTNRERQALCSRMESILTDLLEKVEQVVPQDKKKLVFFPYLVSMWDSLESVWREAMDSGEFEVSVVPIPYYDKNSDGSLGTMHFDGEKYPKEVRVTNWETYSLAEEQPEVVYVHNPYDEINLVTSIHPYFYAKNLKKYVGTLVYIPYFVGTKDVVSEHFCVTPVTVQADKIIVQSEIVKEKYITTFMDFAKENKLQWSRSHLEQKILGLGSPKHDKAEQSVCYEEEIPAEWNKILIKPDGSKKKVIFYNTTLDTILKFGMEGFDKMEDTLAFFQEKSQNIALLWRPHPLMEATLKSMRPQWHQHYVKIVAKYRSEHWGIFDETSDFHRAVALSEGYFGDPSSVVDVFRKTGKPVFLRDVNIKNHKS